MLERERETEREERETLSRVVGIATSRYTTDSVDFKTSILKKKKKSLERLCLTQDRCSQFVTFDKCSFSLQVALKVLSIGQREELLRQGLTDRNQGVQKVVEKELGKVLENILE